MILASDLPLVVWWLIPIAVLAMAIPACRLLRSARSGQRFPREHCQRCGFPRSDNPHRSCPECGASAAESTRRVGPAARTAAAALSLVMFAPALVQTPALTWWILGRQSFADRFPDSRMRLLLWLDAPELANLKLDLESTVRLSPATLTKLTARAFELAQVPQLPSDAPLSRRRSITEQLSYSAAPIPSPRLADDLGALLCYRGLDDARRGAILRGYLQAVSPHRAFDSSPLAANLAEMCWGGPVTTLGNTKAVAGGKAFSTLTPAQISELASTVLARQADPEKTWSPLWGAAFEGLASQGLLAENLVERYRQHAAMLHIRLPGTPLHAGEAAPAILDYELRTGGRVDFSGRFVPDEACADAVHRGADWKWKVAPPMYPQVVLVLTPKSPGTLVITGTATIELLPDREGVDRRLSNAGETSMRFWLKQPRTMITQHVSIECQVLPARTPPAPPSAAQPTDQGGL